MTPIAEEARRRIVDIRRQQGKTLAPALRSRGDHFYVLQKPSEAEPLFRQALEIAQQTADTDEIAGLCNRLAMIYQQQQRYAEAETLFRSVLAMKGAAVEHSCE